MVDLYNLKLMADGLDSSYWPADIDQHVANVDFGEASLIEQSVSFASIMADPNLISTDSLNMEALRARCEANKNNNYKLTFEDSGQWTTSGIGGSFTTNNTSCPHVAGSSKKEHYRNVNDFDHVFPLHLLEKLNNNLDVPNNINETKYVNEFLDQPNTSRNNLSFKSWGRIQNIEPFEEKTYSLPELNQGGKDAADAGGEHVKIFGSKVQSSNTNKSFCSNHLNITSKYSEISSQKARKSNGSLLSRGSRRPPSLLADFLSENKEYELDLQQNRSKNALLGSNELPTTVFHKNNGPHTSCLANDPNSLTIRTPRRTFADLSPSQTAPNLNFLSLPHKVPGFCRPSPSPGDIIPTADGTLENINEINYLYAKTSDSLNEEDHPDSGLGASGNFSGPSHIEDWTSLSILLPRHVVEACSFFKSNSFLLTGSSNNIERPSKFPLSRNFPRFSINSNNIIPFRDCPTCHNSHSSSEVFSRNLSFSSYSRLENSCKLRLHLQELSLIGLPLYDQKRELVEKVIYAIAEITRGILSIYDITLWTKLKDVFEDGLKTGSAFWNFVLFSNRPGQSDGKISNLIRTLELLNENDSSLIIAFLKGLYSLNSLDGWLSYIVLKAELINQYYVETAFISNANTVYRSLFHRLIEALGLLPVIDQTNKKKLLQKISLESKHEVERRNNYSPQFPKSSSPLNFNTGGLNLNELISKNEFRYISKSEEKEASLGNNASSESLSRIPVCRAIRQEKCSKIFARARSQSSTRKSNPIMGRAKFPILPVSNGEVLPLSNGELVRILSVRDNIVRFCRLNARRGFITNGKVPNDFIDPQVH